ncbi:unnamed protein product [Gadus morhua 'NCC']
MFSVWTPPSEIVVVFATLSVKPQFQGSLVTLLCLILLLIRPSRPCAFTVGAARVTWSYRFGCVSTAAPVTLSFSSSLCRRLWSVRGQRNEGPKTTPAGPPNISPPSVSGPRLPPGGCWRMQARAPNGCFIHRSPKSAPRPP